jgi:hypothetical protein
MGLMRVEFGLAQQSPSQPVTEDDWQPVALSNRRLHGHKNLDST